MKVLYLTHTVDTTNGWGRYADGFIRSMPLAGEKVVAPSLEGRASVSMRRHQPLCVPIDALRLLPEARKADLIHALTEWTAPLAMTLSALSGRPYAVSVIGTYSVLETYPSGLRWLYRSAFRRAHGAAILSSYTGSVAGKHFPNADKRIVHGGFDAPAGKRRPEGPRAPYRVLAVGGLKPRKGFHTLIEAARLLKERGIDVRIDVVGSGLEDPYGKKLLEMVKNKGLEARVRFKGVVTDGELDALYRSSDLFVLPSEHDGIAFEGLGLVYLEAMARGLPCVACLESGATDIVRDGVNGRLVPPASPEDLASAIADSLSEESAWKRMSDAALHTVEGFRWRSVAEDMKALHDQVVSRRH